MVLTPASLFYYLRDRGTVTADAVVDGDFRVYDLSRRNQAFRVSFQERPDYLVKQVGDWRRSNVRTFETEAHWYWLARNHSGFAPLAPFLSTCSGYDAENQILILDIPRKSKDLDRHFRLIGRFPTETAQLLGETLGAFHTALPDGVREELRSDFRQAVPWVLSLQEMSESSIESKGSGVTELLGIVRGHPEFGEAFEELRSRWRRETLINGDMKFAHCILVPEQRLYFIDWEMADFGDPGWDLGAIFQEYLSAWLRSMPSQARVPTDLVGRASQPLKEIQPAIRAFWKSYLLRTGSDESTAAEMLDRTVGYTAAWLIQAAYQSLREAERITTRAVCMAQLSLNIFRSRGEAAHGLLGL